MRAVRLGSYSMCATFAGTPSLFLLKSTTRLRRLSTSLRSGRERVTSSNEDTLAPRLAGDVGLYLRTAIALLPRLEDLDAVALGEGDHRALLVRALADRPASPLDLPLAVQSPDRGHAYVPDLLDRLLDLGLGRARVDQ